MYWPPKVGFFGPTLGGQYIQFSDYEIAPTKVHHFHIFMVNTSQKEILEEMENWPTYYPANLIKEEIAHEMLAH